MKVVLAGGGTGGHVYPALAVGARLRERGADLVYYGTRRGPERTAAGRADITFRSIPASQLRGRSPLRVSRGMVNFLRGCRAAARWMETDEPAAVFATGGYAAAPVGRAARRKGVPLVLFLPDVYPGWAVRYMARSATVIACTVEDSLEYLPGEKTVVTGYPVRPEFFEATREEAQRRFHLEPEIPTVLIAGGSTGAHQLNLVIHGALPDLLERMQIIHVCGRSEEQWLARERDRMPEWQRNRYHLFAYTDEMAYAMAAADLAVTRAGASTLGELPATGVPAIVVPLDASDQHVNARFLTEQGAAVTIPSSEVDCLLDGIEQLLRDEPRRAAMARAMRGLARPNAAGQIADMLWEAAR